MQIHRRPGCGVEKETEHRCVFKEVKRTPNFSTLTSRLNLSPCDGLCGHPDRCSTPSLKLCTTKRGIDHRPTSRSNFIMASNAIFYTVDHTVHCTDKRLISKPQLTSLRVHITPPNMDRSPAKHCINSASLSGSTKCWALRSKVREYVSWSSLHLYWFPTVFFCPSLTLCLLSRFF